ncbi:hypothetical protein Acsp01_20060 [Actinoplanes sp. NBRC 101535]|nr:hypothetical protein Acsp01_20060 [Actinoplanes sp. NBRC 101535]
MSVGACDLGIFYQAVQGWAFGGWPYVPIKGYPQIGDHFSPIYAVLAPIAWAYDSPITLVYAQVVLICLSGVPIYHIFRRRFGILAGTGMLLAYLGSHAVLGTIQFPVHEVMFGALFLAWGLERALAGRWTQATILFALLVTVKEDGGLMCALLALYALLNRRLKHAVFLVLWGAFWFLISLKVIIPALNPGGFTYAVDYQQSLHADGIFAGIPYMLSHPLEILNLMYDQPAKVETWQQLLIPIGFAALASPLALLIAPVMLSRMLSSRETQWSSHLYYDMPLMPILFAAVADGARRIGSLVDRLRGLGPDRDWAMASRVPKTEEGAETAEAAAEEKKRPWWQVRTGAILASVAAVTFVWFAWQDFREDNILKWYQEGQPAFGNHLVVAEAKQAFTHIPADVTVRATNNLLIPLLSTNEVTLIGSNVDEGDWAVVDTVNPSCPIGKGDIPKIMQQLDGMGFREVFSTGRIKVLNRTAEATQPIRGTGQAS